MKPWGVLYGGPLGLPINMNQPHITNELIAWLEEKFPNKLPDEPIEKDALALLIGNQQVIAHLKTIRDRQEKQGITSILGKK